MIAEQANTVGQMHAAQQALARSEEQRLHCEDQLYAFDGRLASLSSELQIAHKALFKEQDSIRGLQKQLAMSHDQATTATTLHIEAICLHQSQALEQEQKQAVLTEQLLNHTLQVADDHD